MIIEYLFTNRILMLLDMKKILLWTLLFQHYTDDDD